MKPHPGQVTRDPLGVPNSFSPQLSSSDMSLQSGRRSQRYSRATHSLWLWQANSVSVQTLGRWGTVGQGGCRRESGSWLRKLVMCRT